jgi:hypothetical protein
MKHTGALAALLVSLFAWPLGCVASDDSPAGAAVCTPGGATFGARCCAPEDCGDAGLECQAGRCTKPCVADAGDCDGLGADGGARPCSGGYCVPPPLPNAGGDDGSGW